MGHSAASAFSRPGAPSTTTSSGVCNPRRTRSSSSARQAASPSPPMLLIASNIFWPSARTPSATSNEIEVALLSSRTRATVPSRISRTIGSSASERAFQAFLVRRLALRSRSRSGRQCPRRYRQRPRFCGRGPLHPEAGGHQRSSMTRERASIFAGDDAPDVSGFAPKAAHELNRASAALVRGIAEASRFPSREAKTSSAMRRPPRIHRTGRTMQFNGRHRLDRVVVDAHVQGEERGQRRCNGGRWRRSSRWRLRKKTDGCGSKRAAQSRPFRFVEAWTQKCRPRSIRQRRRGVASSKIDNFRCQEEQGTPQATEHLTRHRVVSPAILNRNRS